MRTQTIYRHSGEEIVRQHRQEMMRRMEKRNEEGTLPVLTQEMPEHFYSLDGGERLPWYQAVNWWNVIGALGWAVVAGVLLYLGIVVIGSFGFRIFGR